MTKKMQLVMVAVADLHVGDLLLLPEALVAEPITVEVTALTTRPRTRQTSVWVRSTHADRTIDRAWHYGTFKLDHPIQRMEFS